MQLRTKSRLIGLGLALLASSASMAQTSPDIGALRAESLRLVNVDRAERGLESLSLSEPANEAASSHAGDMLERGFYDHVTPEGGTVLDRHLAAGGNSAHVARENLYRCQGCDLPADLDAIAVMHEGWMNSPGHRENILAEGITLYGFGLAEGAPGTQFGVQVFTGPGTPRGLDAGAEPVALSADAQAGFAADLINAARRDRGVDGIEPAADLTDTAGRVMAQLDRDDPLGGPRPQLDAALPQAGPWRRFQLVMGSCTGCGTAPSEADLRFFIGQWLSDPGQADSILDGALTHLGLVLRADGDGRKTAILILAG